MVIDFKKYVSFRCSECGEESIEKLNIFDLSPSSELILACRCGSDCVSIMEKSGKYHIKAVCAPCLDTHSFVLSKKAFWNKSISSFYCPQTSFGILNIGDYREVTHEAEKQNQMIEEFIMNIDPADMLDDMPFGEDTIAMLTGEKIRRLANENKIYCVCESRDISSFIHEDYIELFCNRCGKSKIIKTATKEDFYNINIKDSIIIGTDDE